MASPNLNITEVSASQNQKEVTINNAIIALDNAGNSSLSVDVSAGDTTLTSANLRGYLLFKLTGAPGAAFDLNVPASIKRLIAVQNTSGQTATVQVTGGAGLTVDIEDGDSFILYVDGADVIALGGGSGGSVAHTVSTFFQGDGFDENAELTYVFAEDVIFADDLAGSQGYAQTVAATGTVDIDVEKNGSSVGTISFAVSTATATFVTAGGTVTFAPGDRLTFVCPAAFDSLAGIAITLLGVKVV